MKKHFVRFFSPGTFVSEMTVKPIDSWDTEKAMEMARDVIERHRAVPYAFRFETRARGDDELDSRVVKTSRLYHLGGKVETLAEIESRNDPDEKILRDNMRINGYDKIIINTNSYKSTHPLGRTDKVLDFKMPSVETTKGE